MLQHAFKEWAVICHALATGKQALLLRKGGIAETDGAFAVEHNRFWLFPTYTHQQRDGIQPEAVPWLEEVERQRPPADRIRLSHFAEVTGIYHVHDLAGALIIGGLHFWSEATVRARLAYRRPELYVLAVRIFRAAAAVELPNTAEYDGCRTWVELAHGISTANAIPVLSDAAYHDTVRKLNDLLTPTACA